MEFDNSSNSNIYICDTFYGVGIPYLAHACISVVFMLHATAALQLCSVARTAQYDWLILGVVRCPIV